jgi:hypothetical protein
MPALKSRDRRWRTWRGLAWAGLPLALLLSLLLPACGGGGVGGQGTGGFAYVQGPISGYASIIVNGVDLDDTAADLQVGTEDGLNLGATDLKLGMTVQVDSSAIDPNTLKAVARRVVVTSEILGPVQANDLVAETLTVLGQKVQITQSTVLDPRLVGGQAGIALGSELEVYAIYDPSTATYAARRIEPRSQAVRFKVRGLVHDLNTDTQVFGIGAANFSYSGSKPADLVNGGIVRVYVQPQPDPQGRWTVISASRTDRVPAEGAEVEVESVITSYTSAAQFVVSGLTVDASTATLSPAGSSLASGLRVEVEGVMRSGVLLARKVEIKGSGSDSGGDDSGGGQEFEIHGQISSVDSVAKTLVVRGALISYAGPVRYSGGTQAQLVVNAKVEVKGQLSADGAVVNASEIKFDN